MVLISPMYNSSAALSYRKSMRATPLQSSALNASTASSSTRWVSSGLMGAGIWRLSEDMPLLGAPFVPFAPPLAPRRYFSSKDRKSDQRTGISVTEAIASPP